jgi:hypothetical protein
MRKQMFEYMTEIIQGLAKLVILFQDFTLLLSILSATVEKYLLNSFDIT